MPETGGKAQSAQSRTASKRVFISYSSRDRAEALAVRDLLEAEQCQVWMDIFDIQIGAELDDQLVGNINRADVLCLLVSPTSTASPWVEREVEVALGQESTRGVRIVAVILRPCDIPPSLSGRVLVDALEGVDAETTRLTLRHAVLGEDAVPPTEIDDAFRKGLADRAQQLAAAEVLPQLAPQLDRIRAKPIRHLELSLDGDAMLQGERRILVLELLLDPLSSGPMYFYFAPFREGATWPLGFDLPESPYTHFGLGLRRIDAKFRWQGRVLDLVQTTDATDLGDPTATFSLELDGEEFRGPDTPVYAGGPTIPDLPHTLEIPPLQQLIDHEVTFRLSAHDPATRSAKWIDVEKTDLAIRVVASFPEEGNFECLLFRTSHDQLERALLQGTYLTNIQNPVEREAVLNLYAPLMQRKIEGPNKRRQEAEQLFESGNVQWDGDRRLLGRHLLSEAQLAAFRGQTTQAVDGYLKVIALMEPLVLGRVPDYRDAQILYTGYEQAISLLLSTGAVTEAESYAEAMLKTTETSTDNGPDYAEYQRWQAGAFKWQAVAAGKRKDFQAAVRHLASMVDKWRALYEQLPDDNRRQDLSDAVDRANRYVHEWGLKPNVGSDAWRKELPTKP